jgi:hypothetical protein
MANKIASGLPIVPDLDAAHRIAVVRLDAYMHPKTRHICFALTP